MHVLAGQGAADGHVFGVPSHGREPQEGAGALIHAQVGGPQQCAQAVELEIEYMILSGVCICAGVEACRPAASAAKNCALQCLAASDAGLRMLTQAPLPPMPQAKQGRCQAAAAAAPATRQVKRAQTTVWWQSCLALNFSSMAHRQHLG